VQLKKSILLFLSIFSITVIAVGQNLRVQSKDTVNGKPSWDAYLYFKMKLNGVFDISGGLQGQETFNIHNIDIWGTDDTPNLWMDLHQSQLRLYGAKEVGNHTAVGYFEGDFWGGNNHFRLRMAYINYHFFQFGQDWSFFGDKEIWPNVFDWDGPPSGVWRRNPGLMFFPINNNRWRLDVGFEHTQAQISFVDDLDSTFQKASGNPTPESIVAIKKMGNFGHIRLSGLLRFLHYKENNQMGYVPAYGFSLSGFLKTHKEKVNPIQFQLVAGTGIASYLVSFDGAQYDAIPNGYGDINTLPAAGGWVSYEHWFGKMWHGNIVLGSTIFKSFELSDYYVPAADLEVSEGSVDLKYIYALINLMVDPFKDFTVGIEYNIGQKQNVYKGKFNGSDQNDELIKDRIAQRISFGLFYNF